MVIAQLPGVSRATVEDGWLKACLWRAAGPGTSVQHIYVQWEQDEARTVLFLARGDRRQADADAALVMDRALPLLAGQGVSGVACRPAVSLTLFMSLVGLGPEHDSLLPPQEPDREKP
ncbi:hypothetical protein [Streptomyces sp. MST-110588]|uniref:hypothetical protein n=1 Tax=Streptomyces sp. MST-110588 TaxID=2833628 RepID=UPI001F5C6171|nr:hypothetical protein [Streptomyces sp. MST-110588]UNO41617.1 hypothetical protein KGS77_21280 [Streptomyces sp. MST-110588]